MTEFTTWRSLVDGEEIATIPDSVVSRPDDDNSFSTTEFRGLQINSDLEWPSIGAEISANTSDATDAYVYRVSDGTLLGQTDISGLGAGDTFTVDDVNIQANTDYNFILNADGNSWTAGFTSEFSYPYTSEDGNLSIVNDATGETTSSDENPVALTRIGNVGFD